MKKKIVFIICIFLIPLNVFGLTYPTLHYKTAIIYDMTDENILYSLSSDKITSIASLTKIMTTIVAIENINDLNERVIYTKEMASLVRSDASVAGLKIGDIVTYKDLLYASILPSGADATIALSISLNGSIEAFVKKMNELANNLELKNTHFVNVTGLDAEGHYSTLEDILKLLKYSLNNDLFKEIYTTKEYILSNDLKVESTLYLYNKDNIYDIDKIIGSKTGFTNNAGLCISALFKVKDHDMLLITTGAPKNTHFYNIADALYLIDFLDSNYQEDVIVSSDTVIKKIKVKDSKISEYSVTPEKDITLFVASDYDKDKIAYEYNGLEELTYKNKYGEKIGDINYYYDNKLIEKESVILNDQISPDIKGIIYDNKYYIGLITVIMIIFVKKIKA